MTPGQHAGECTRNAGTTGPSRRVLLVYYSQTGSTQRLAESFCAPLHDAADIEVTKVALQPVQPYPFPWPFLTFLDTFPETVQLHSPELEPLSVEPDTRYDLIILSYPVWFLSPAPPMTAFLASDTGRRLVKDTPTITLIGCRNMWLSAHETASRMLRDAGALHCDNVVVTDKGPGLATFITTPRWVLTGRRDSFMGLPPAGISDADIVAAKRFGHAIVAAFRHDRVSGQRPLLTGLRAVTVDDAMLASERVGHRSFKIWSRLLRRCGKPGTSWRRVVLLVYCLFLVTMIMTVVPLSLVVRSVLRRLRPHAGAQIRQLYAAPSGSADDRMEEFDI